jgi:hypothetical protein
LRRCTPGLSAANRNRPKPQCAEPASASPLSGSGAPAHLRADAAHDFRKSMPQSEAATEDRR